MSERKSRNVFVITWLSLVIGLMMMSCGGTSFVHVGTGYPAKKSCSGSPLSHPQY
tara:strand:- start:467 stop:631 length:165 start_codon:yes stop_codon:yes gene_type:complete